jgi:hypothetical protein
MGAKGTLVSLVLISHSEKSIREAYAGSVFLLVTLIADHLDNPDTRKIDGKKVNLGHRGISKEVSHDLHPVKCGHGLWSVQSSLVS